MKFLLLLLFFLKTPAMAALLILKAGETKPLLSTGTAWVERSKVIQVRQSSQGFLVKGLRPGSSLLKIRRSTYQVHVLSPLQERTLLRLESALKKTLGLQIKIVDSKVVIQGRLLRWDDWETLYSACQPNYCDYSMEADLAESLHQRFEKYFSNKMKKLGLPPQRLVGEKPFQILLPPKAPQISRMKDIIRAFGINVQTVENAVDLAPLIKVQITVAEVKRSETLKYGIQWPTQFNAQLIPKYAPAVDNQPWSVQALENQGLAKVLATPTLLCRSGKEANFLAGGEFPIKLVNYKTQDVIWRKYGIILKITPTADYSGKMSIGIETEISSIDPARTVDGLPGLFTNRIQTHFDLSEPRTLALSGLIKNEDAKNTQGFPGLSRIPILGALFGSKEFIENRTELVVFVRPEIVSPGTLEAEE